MASGHVNRTYRPNTWLHRPMLQNATKALANSEPSTHGTKRTCRPVARCPLSGYGGTGSSYQRARRGLVSNVTFRLLSGHSGHDEGIFRGITNVPGGLQGAPNIGIFRAAVKGDQPHAIWTLNLIAVLESISSL